MTARPNQPATRRPNIRPNRPIAAMPTLTRPDLVHGLRQLLQGLPQLDAAWEGGSAAFGTEDQFSDVDAVAVVADDALATTWAAIEAGLNALSPVTLRHDVPDTRGYAQRFFRLRDAGEFTVVDLVLIRRSDPLLFRELELHGRGRTWFDRTGVLVEVHLDAVQDLAAARARVPALAAAFEMFQHIVTKERLRGRAVEALMFYQAFTWRPLVEALRLLHCPPRRVFGPRYLARDLPPQVCARIEALVFVRDLDHLAQQHETARRWFALCIARLQSHGPGAGIDAVADDGPGAA